MKEIEIYTKEDLFKIGKCDKFPKDGNYKLMNDITFEKDYFNEEMFEVIYSFSGTFDGNNHCIKNVITDEYKIILDPGLFIKLDESAIVENLILDNWQYYISECSGMLCSENYGIIRNCKIRNSNISILMSEDDDENYEVSYIGSFAYSNLGKIINCEIENLTINSVSDSIFNFSSINVGGIVSENKSIIDGCKIKNLSINNCKCYIGGIAYINHENSKISNCKIDLNINYGDYVGGICQENHGIICNCDVSGFIENCGNNIASIVDYNGDSGQIQDCSFNVTISKSKSLETSGLCNRVGSSKIKNCTGKSDIIIEMSDIDLYTNEIDEGNTLENCSNTGNIKIQYKTKSGIIKEM